jgi:hypothetical protein
MAATNPPAGTNFPLASPLLVPVGTIAALAALATVAVPDVVKPTTVPGHFILVYADAAKFVAVGPQKL